MKQTEMLFKKRYNATVIHRVEIPQKNGNVIRCETVLVNGEKLVVVQEVKR